MSALGSPQVNKSELDSSLGHPMSLAVGGRDKAGVIPVQQGPMSGGGVVVGWVRFIASCVMVT